MSENDEAVDFNDGRWHPADAFERVEYERALTPRDHRALLDYTYQTWGPHGVRAWWRYQWTRLRLRLSMWRSAA